MKKLNWFTVAEAIILVAIIWLLANMGKAQTGGLSPYGNAWGPHQLTYPCTSPVPPGCAGLHWVPGQDPYQGPQVFSTDPFQVMLGFRQWFPHPAGTSGVAYLPMYAFNAFNARLPELDGGCTNVNVSRAGCTYPNAWYSWDYVEPGAQAIFTQIQDVLADDPGFQVNCLETQTQWTNALLGIPYQGPQTCPVAPRTPTPTATPCPKNEFGVPTCATTTPTVTPTSTRTAGPSVTATPPASTATPTPTPSPVVSPCGQPSPTVLCVNGRFKVSMTFGSGSSATAVPLTGTDGGYFWFYQASNPEVFVKVLNGCSNNSNWWVFAAGLTNVQTAITVVDTKSGLDSVNVYSQPANVPFVAIQDVKAFPCQ